ncbi:MAG: response regulator transcription factor [Clostridia bacterium]|nr:response regulator transcription factor [Clostridia bacterium]
MRLLLVEDERALSHALVNMFEKEKIEVTPCYDGKEGLEYALTGTFDVILLDVLMPKMNGFDVLKEIRKNKITTPILMLTALSGESDKVKGLDLGADDYLAKPFGFGELMARVRALLRRGQSTLIIDNRLSYGNAELDVKNSMLHANGKEVQLSAKELGILKFFFERSDFVGSKEEIINRAWGLDGDFLSNNLEVYVSFIRKKLNFVDADFTIESLRGIGYKLTKK